MMKSRAMFLKCDLFHIFGTKMRANIAKVLILHETLRVYFRLACSHPARDGFVTVLCPAHPVGA
jgi:hypothetical protein